MTVFDTVAAALRAASAAGVVDTARQGVYQTASGARAAQATAPGMPTIARVYASELLDSNTCQPCAAVDGKEYASVDDAHGEYHGHGGYMGCSGGLRCRGTLVFVYSSETPAGGDDGLPPYTPTSITPQPNPPPWSPPTMQPAPPPPPGFTGVQINDVYGDKVLVAVRQDGSFVWPQRSPSGKWVGSDGHPLPDDVVRWLDSHPVSKDWKPNWAVADDVADDATQLRPPAGYTGNVHVEDLQGGKVLVVEKADGSMVWPARRADGKWVDTGKAYTSDKDVPLPDDVQRWLDAHPTARGYAPKPKPAEASPVEAPGSGVNPWDPQARATHSQRTGGGTNDTGTTIGGDLVTTNDLTLQHVGTSMAYNDRRAIETAWANGHAVLRPFKSFTSTNHREALLRSRGAVKAMDEAPLLGVDRVWRGMRVTSESMWDNFRAMQPGDVLDTKGAASFTTSLRVADDFAGQGRRVIVDYENPRGIALEGITEFRGEHEVMVRGVRHELVVQSVEYSPDGQTMLLRVTERAFSQFAAPHTDRVARVKRAMDYLFKSAKMTYADGSLFA